MPNQGVLPTQWPSPRMPQGSGRDGGGAGPQTDQLPSAAVQLSKGMFEQDNMPPTAQIKCYQEQVGQFEGKRSQQSDQGSDSMIWLMFPLRLARGEVVTG